MSISGAVRGFLKRLPVLREPEAQRLAAVVGVASRTCARCDHFDREGGERLLRANPAFRMAAAHLTPSQMRRSNHGAWDAGNGFDAQGQPNDDGGPHWEELGVCRSKTSEVGQKGTFARSTCKAWE